MLFSWKLIDNYVIQFLNIIICRCNYGSFDHIWIMILLLAYESYTLIILDVSEHVLHPHPQI